VADNGKHEQKVGERLAKMIARAGLASRREAELWIAAGRVAVNGAVIRSPACNVTAQDRVTVDGEPLPAKERTRLFIYHKPRGLITTHADPQGRPTIFQKLPRHLPRLISVGRLDFNTEGLLLLTNDGALARLLELPATGWLRRYRVRAHGTVTQDKLGALRAGVTISGIHYGPIEAALDRVQGSNLWLTFAIREGKNREVRNVLGHLGLVVTRLIRVSFGPFQLGELAEGAIEEVRTRVLREQLGARLAGLSGADFSAPRSEPPALQERDRPRRIVSDSRQSKSREPQGHNLKSHSWREPQRERPHKPLRRKFHGSRRNDALVAEQPATPTRADVLTDRKGRSIAVERQGRPATDEQRQERGDKHPRKRGRRRAPDRAFGARPRHPRDRR
jgi:23S rRNA pseudouridine2605 synthase